MNAITKHKESSAMLAEIEDTQKMCNLLMQSPHYKKMGSQGVFAIVEKARSVGVNPMDALNGGMYFVQGKVEMASAMMNQLIRQAGHSITKDRKSDNTICILHGRRADNGDTWTESFSIEDAKLAGIYRNQWLKYPKDMLFARALSRLARQLFPDVIKGCYVQGEIEASVNRIREAEVEDVTPVPTISDEQLQKLGEIFENNPVFGENVRNFMKKKYGIEKLNLMPVDFYGEVIDRAKRIESERKAKEYEAAKEGEIEVETEVAQ